MEVPETAIGVLTLACIRADRGKQKSASWRLVLVPSSERSFDVQDSSTRFYAEIAATYDNDVQSTRYDNYRDTYLDLIGRHRGQIARPAGEGARLLDVGCGTGTLSALLADSGFNVVGIDSSEAMLRIAMATHAGQSVSFHRADVRRLPAIGPFDVVVSCGDPLNHLRDHSELALALAQISAVLADHGLVMLDFLGRLAFERLLKRGSLVEDNADGVRVLRWTRVRPGALSVRTTVEHRTSAAEDGRPPSVSHLDEVFFDAPAVREAASRAGLTEVRCYGLRDGKLDGEFDDQRHARFLVVADNHR